MKKKTAAEAPESEITGISLEDGMKAVEVVKAALRHRPYLTEAVLGARWTELSKEQQLTEFLTPRIGIYHPDKDKNISTLFLRITGEEGPVVEAIFYPIEAAWSFLEVGRDYARRYRSDDSSDEEVEGRAFEFAQEMMLMMIDNLYKRSLLMMDSFTEETIAQWYSNRDQGAHAYLAAKGENRPKPKPLYLDSIVKDYGKNVRDLWKYQGQSLENWQKMQLVDHYEALCKHWQRLLKMASKDEADWEQYAKAGKYADTPDDLIKRLQDVDRSNRNTVNTRVSELALEHAARRVGLIKRSGISEWARKKRKAGLVVSDYSPQQLFQYLKEGRDIKLLVEQNLKVQEQMASYPEPTMAPDPALEKKRKSLEQKLEFVLKKVSRSAENTGESAKEKKSER
ncbi:MAG TPA: hypothetical protein PKD24_16185 [Pyrinomonadaceae bacterium]|nr:hypothetical protein [Pyrinomonadaceae bacterium]HMP66908.1 hypothetical protein [Pyrinomonadaceae bacterium]